VRDSVQGLCEAEGLTRLNVALLDAVCISVLQFCENNVKNLRDSNDENCKPLFFNNLHSTLNAKKYLQIAPTPGIYSALSVLGLVSSTVERAGFQ
jgi:hypothetical protein